MAFINTGSAAAAAPFAAALDEALLGLQGRLDALTATSEGWLALLRDVFGAGGLTVQETFEARAEQLRQQLRAGTVAIGLDLRSGAELQGGLAAYSAGAAGQGERIYLNADWAATASPADLSRYLLEEFGHAVDQRLNGGADTAGDEGELFAARVLGSPLDAASLSRISQENDHGVLQLDGQAVAVEFGALPPDRDGDGVADATDLDDDNDGILDSVEQQKRAATALKPSNDDFRYAQNTFGFQSFHSAALEYQKGTRNDPYLLFDGLSSTELRVHSDDVYEFRLSATPVQAGSSFTLEEADGGNDAKVAVLGSLGTTDANRNTLNATGGGKGWATIRANFDGLSVAGSVRSVTTVADLETLFNLNGKQPLVGRNNSILLFAGASDKTQTFTTSIAIDHFQIVGLEKHGGWSGLTLNAEVDNSLDTDSDTITNNRDLDSDNDGISDLAESVGWSTTAAVMVADADRDGTISKAEALAYMNKNGGWLGSGAISANPDFNSNGLWDFLETGGTTPLNSDADKLADFLDLDSDGDGIPDTVELQPSSSTSATAYLANDGDVRGEDADGDGVIARFDSNDATGTFGGSFKDPVNTDSSKEGVGTLTQTGIVKNAYWIFGGADWQASPANYTCLNAIASDGKLDKSSDGYAKLKSKDSDNLVLDFNVTLSAGTTIRIRAASGSDPSSGVTRRFKVNAASDSSGTDIAGTDQTLNFTLNKQLAEDFTYTVGAGGLRYLEFTALKSSNNSDAELRLDYVGWSNTVATPLLPDYLDRDSDNDGLLDKTEFIPSGSKLSLTGTDSNFDGLDDGIQTDGGVTKSYEDPDGLIDSPRTGPNVPLKNNDADSTDVDYRTLNTGAFTVSNVRVNEGSPYAVFAISRPNATGANVKLLLNTTGSGPGFATIGDQITAPVNDVVRNIEYFDGSAWVAYSSGNKVSSVQGDVLVPGDRPLLVRVGIRNDSVFEGPETFRLEVRNPTSPNALVDASGGTCTILDDRTGDVWLETNKTQLPDEDQPLDDDRRLVTIDDLYINEGNGTAADPRYAVFTLTGSPGQTLTTLTLQSGTATAWNGSGSLDVANGTTDFRNALQYLKSDGTWANLPSTLPNLDETGTLQVRVAVYNDSKFESGLPNGPEKFTLTATYTDYASKAATTVGTAYIYDDGTGNRLEDVNGDPIPDTVPLDDDTPVYVSNPVVNEASSYIFFDVEGTPGRVLTLALGTTTASPTNKPATITGFTTEFSLDGGSTWTTYSSSSKPTIPNSGDVLVRVLITPESDTTFEGPETFTLTATPDSGQPGTGTGTIIDNGTGPVYNNDGSINPSATPDDDRPLSVTSPTVSESSPYAVFTVAAAANETIALQLAGLTALIGPGAGSDFGPSIEINTGSGWVAYTPGDSITVPANGQLLARTPIIPDNRYEGPETFTLTASYTSGGSKSSVGTATITDDGSSANTFEAGNTTGTATQGTADNDKPLVSVSSITVSESSLFAVVEVSLSNPSNFPISFTPSLVSGTATAGVDTANTPSGVQIEFFNGSAWVSAAGGVTLAPGATSVLLRTAITDDNVFEGPESLQISTGTITGAVKNTQAATGTITITDDGTSGQRFEANTNSKVPNEGTPDNDKPTISITPNLTVSEAFLNGDPNYAVVKVSLTNTSTTAVTFSPSLASATATLATLPIADGGDDDFGPDLEVLYLDASGNPIGTWATVSGAVSIDAGRTQLLLRTKINNDTAYEISETFKIKTNATTGVKNPLGVESTVTITDDGRPNVSFFAASNTTGNGTTGTSDDDRKALFVSGGTFNEGSKFAIFTVGNTPGNTTKLTVRNGTASVLPGGSQPTIRFSTDGGTTWQTYSPTNQPTSPVGTGLFLVAVDISNETDAIYEGPEVFFLDVEDGTDSSKTANGSATIVDDGSGSLVKLRVNGDPDAANNQFVPDTTTTPDDDRPTISVGSITVSESSPYAVVKVSLSNLSNFPVFFTPSLQDGSAQVGVDTQDTDTGGDLEYFDGSNWVSTSSGVTIAAGDLYVLLRAKIVDDNTYEGPETLQVVTGVIDGAVKNASSGASGTITITDDGSSGARFEETTNIDTPISGTADNDTPTVSVSSITVSESSAFAVVEVSLNKLSKYPISFTPSLTGVTATVGVDTTTTPSTAQIEYFDGTNWLSASSGVTLVAGSSSVLLRTAIVNDNIFEGKETLNVNTGALTVGSGKVTNPAGAFGVVTIVDDGSSTNTFPIGANVAAPVPGTADNDTPQISVSSVTVSESSPFAVVRVELANLKSSKYPISFTPSLVSGTATAGVDTTNTPTGAQIEFFNGSAWVSALNGVTLAPGVTSVLLRTAIVNDTVYEGPESLQIRTGPINVGTAGGAVTNPLGAAGTITITDNGSSGNRFEGNNNTDTPTQGTPDDDRPVVSITPLATVGETQDGTTRIVNFSINLSKASTSTITVNYSTSTIIPNGVTPLGFAAAGKVGNVADYIATSGVDFTPIVNAQAIFQPGATSLILPAVVIGDNLPENTESFFVTLNGASSNAKIGDGNSEIAIFDNDGPDGNNLVYDFSSATTPLDLRGGDGNDTIRGGIAADVLSGDPPTGTTGGADVIWGNLGADTITGGPGNDRLIYNSFAESTVNNLDRIRDFTPGTTTTPLAGDRIDLVTVPSKLYNRGVISGVTTVSAAFNSAFLDVASGTTVTQALGANEAVLFAFDARINGVTQRTWLLAVNDAVPARNDAADLLINVTGLAGVSGFTSAASSTALAPVTIDPGLFFV